jgi:single stranded DNA-binding protein
MYNKVALVGRLTHYPRLSKTRGGVPVLSCRVAVDSNYKVSGRYECDYINLVAYYSNAVSIAKLTKGDIFLAEGRLRNRNYTDKCKQKRTVSEVVVEDVHYIRDAKLPTENCIEESGD